MITVPDPMSVHWPKMSDDQHKNAVFLKPLVASPKIEVGEFTDYNDTDDPTAFETRNVLYTAGPEKLITGKFCAIAMGAKFLLSSANHPVPRLVELVHRRHHGTRPYHLDRYARQLEHAAKDAGLLEADR